MSLFRFFLILCLLLFCYNQTTLVYAQTAHIAGPKITSDFNLLDISHPLARVLNEKLFAKLVRPGREQDFSLDVAENLRFSNNELIITIKQEANFSSGARITYADVLWSLIRCKSNGSFSDIEFRLSEESGITNLVLYKESNANIASIDGIPKDLYHCPILERKSTELFGSEFGIGSNFVPSGNFVLSNLKVGSSYQLRQRQSQIKSQESFDTIEVQSVLNDLEGLRLLRSGAINLLFSSNAEVFQKAQADTTLKTGTCWGFSYVARHDFNFSCVS